MSPQSDDAVNAATFAAEAHLRMGDSDGAIQTYRRALQLNPMEDRIHLKLGNLYFDQQRYGEALEAYQRAVRIAPTRVNRYALGQAYLYTGRFTDAETQYREIQRTDPTSSDGDFGLGLTYSRLERYETAIRHFQRAFEIDATLYDALAEMGYAYADMGDMDSAEALLPTLDRNAPALGDTLGRYLYKSEPPAFVFVRSESTFNYTLPNMSPVSALDAYLETPGAEASFSMVFQFNKEMDRESVENQLNWRIRRSSGSGPGAFYNFGFKIADSEVDIQGLPDRVVYNAAALTAAVYFTVRQSVTGDGTIDPAHIEFQFFGTDRFGKPMSLNADQFLGFSGVA